MPNSIISKSRSDEFHMWVGYAITAWANIEVWLFELCWRSLGPNKERAAIVYFRTPTLESRIELVDELVKAVLPKPKRKSGGHHHADVVAWNDLRQRIKEQLHTRRRIAHYPVGPRKVTVEVRPGNEAPKPPRPGVIHLSVAHSIAEFARLEFYMSENERLRGKEGKEAEPLYMGAVKSHCETITTLSGELMRWVQEVFLKHVA